jgi:hypothetical protein
MRSFIHCILLNFVRIIDFRRLGSAGNVTRMGALDTGRRILIWKPERSLEDLGVGRKIILKQILKKLGSFE